MKDSITHKDSPAHGGPDSKEHSAAKPFRDFDSSIAHSSTHRVTHKDNPACGDPDSRECSAANPSGLINPSDPAEGDPPKQKDDHPPETPPRSTPQTRPKTPPVPTPKGKLERLESKLTSLQKRRFRTLKDKGKATKVPPKEIPSSTSPTYIEKEVKIPSSIPPFPEEDDRRSSLSDQSEIASLPTSTKGPKSPDSTTSEGSSSERTPSPIPTMGTVKELADALTDKLKDIGRHPTIPLPQFRGKKGEDPNDHCMKVEDYFAMFNIATDEDQKKRFLETLFEKA